MGSSKTRQEFTKPRLDLISKTLLLSYNLGTAPNVQKVAPNSHAAHLSNTIVVPRVAAAARAAARVAAAGAAEMPPCVSGDLVPTSIGSYLLWP